MSQRTATRARVSTPPPRPGFLASVSRGLDRLLVVSTMALIVALPNENAITYHGVSLSRVIALPVFVLFALRLSLNPRLVFDRVFAVVMVSYLTWAVSSYFWSYSPNTTVIYAITYTQLAILVVIVWQVCSSTERLRMAFGALAFGGGLGSLLSFRTTVAAHGGVPRYSIGDPNDFGVGLAITLMAALHLAITAANLRWRVLWLLLAAVQVAAILRTASRTALVATIVGTVLLLLDRSIWRPRAIVAALLTAGVAYLVVVRVTSASTFGRLGTTVSDAESGDFNKRGVKWDYAFSYWNERPWQGLGAGGYRARSAQDSIGTAVHSVYVGVLTELGLIGLLLFFSMLAVALWRVWRTADRAVTRVFVATFVVWAIGALALTLEIRKMIWLLMAMATCAAITRARHQSPTSHPEGVGRPSELSSRSS